MNVPVILIVEDDEPLLEAVSTKLTNAGLKPLATRSVDQALDFLKNIPQVDAIWVDHYLPEKTGDELVKSLRKDPKYAQTPIFLVTNSVSPEIINHYIGYGITQYFLKVVSPLETIINAITLYLQQHPSSS